MESLKFSSPQEELAYLRAKVLEAERNLNGAGSEQVRETAVRESIAEFKQEAGIGAPVAQAPEVEKDAEQILERHEEKQLEEIVALMEAKCTLGILPFLIVQDKRGPSSASASDISARATRAYLS